MVMMYGSLLMAKDEKPMQNKIIIGLIAALFIVILLFWLYYSGNNAEKLAREYSRDSYLGSIIHLKRENKLKDAIIDSLVKRKEVREVSVTKNNSVLKKRIKALKAPIKFNLGPWDSCAVYHTGELLRTNDSILSEWTFSYKGIVLTPFDSVLVRDVIIATQDTLINNLETENKADSVDFATLITVEKSKDQSQDSISLHWESLYHDSEKDLKKTRRGAKVLKAVGVALAGLLVYQSVK